MTKEEVIAYYSNRHKQGSVIEFMMRYATEVKEKEWNPAFASLLSPELVDWCFHELFVVHTICTVEEIKTGKILKIF